MSDIIDFEQYSKEHGSNKEDPKDGCKYTEHYKAELAKCFGTHIDWNDDEVLYLLEQVENHMYDCDEDGSFPALTFIGLALSSYQSSFGDMVESYLYNLRYLTRMDFSDERDKLDKDMVKAWDAIGDFLHSYYVHKHGTQELLSCTLEDEMTVSAATHGAQFLETVVKFCGGWDNFCEQFAKAAAAQQESPAACQVREFLKSQ